MQNLFDFYRCKLLDFYDIYWRTPGRFEFMDFADLDTVDLYVFKSVLKDLHFTICNKPPKTVEIINSRGVVEYVGTSKDLSEELGISQNYILYRLDTGICEDGYEYRIKNYQWKNKELEDKYNGGVE